MALISTRRTNGDKNAQGALEEGQPAQEGWKDAEKDVAVPEGNGKTASQKGGAILSLACRQHECCQEDNKEDQEEKEEKEENGKVQD